MSIKTIDQSTVSNTGGVAKKINAGAEKMVFDILQSTQYSTPIPSTVRELTTNACDAQREKEMAIEILTGVKTPADYYITRHGAAYDDSNFDRSYYDLAYLNQKDSHVQITYAQNEGIGFCDSFAIKDFGVGIGDARLEGVLELGYSTKRNTAENFGAFGLGAKVALSTGVDFYNITSVHNGRKFKFSCYPYTTKFNVPAFHPFITFSDGSKVHYEETDELNYTEVSFGVKKHNRTRFQEAIDEQLMYLSNVKSQVVYEDGEIHEKKFLSEVIHNSNSLLVADSYMYSKPHIVIVKEPGATTGINYGYVDFRELEMEQLWGAVGLKCPIRQVIKDDYGKETVLQEGVDVTPSREKVIWNEHTKKFVQDLIVRAADEAVELVQEKLDEKDFISWINKCRDVLSQSDSGDNSALRQIARIIDTNNMKPKFPSDKTIQYVGPKGMFKGFRVSKVTSLLKNGKISIETKPLETWSEVEFDNVYFREIEDSRVAIRDHFLLDNNKSFVLITPTDLEPLQLKVASSNIDADVIQLAKYEMNQKKFLPLLEASSLCKTYTSYDPDEDWIAEFKESEIEIATLQATEGLSAAEIRMIEKRIVAYSLRSNGHWYSNSDHSTLTWDKVEPKLKTVMTSTRTTFYGTRENEILLKLAAEIMRHQSPSLAQVYLNIGHYGYGRGGADCNTDPIYYYDEVPSGVKTSNSNYASKEFKEDLSWIETPQLLRVSENKIKYVKKNPNCRPIEDFFLQITDDGKYTMNKEVQVFLEAEIASGTPTWVEELKIVDPRFGDLANFLDRAGRNGNSDQIKDTELSKAYESFLDQTAKLKEFQIYCDTIKDDDNSEALIASKSTELFILADISGAEIFDTTVADYAKIRDEIVDEVDCFLSELTFGYNQSPEFIRELTIYLKSKGKLDIELPLIPNNK